MTEEVMLKMGIDTRAVAMGLRQVRGDFAEMRKDLAAGGGVFGMINRGLGGLGISLGVAAAAGTIAKLGKDAIALAGQINDLSEATGLSGDTLQAWALQVHQSGGNAQSAEKAVAKFAQWLKDQGKSSAEAESELSKLRDRIMATQDPLQQLSIATEVFGEKLAIKVVGSLKQGSKAFEDFKKDALVLTPAEIKALDELGDRVGSLWAKAKVMMGKALAFPTTVGGTREMLDNLDRQAAELRQARPGNVEDAKKVAEAAAKLAKVERDLIFEQRTEAMKVEFLQKELNALKAQEQAEEKGTVKQLELKTKALEKQKELETQTERVRKQESDFLEKKQRDQEKINQQKQKELEIIDGINEAGRRADDAQRSLESKLGDETKFTLGDLAGLGIDRATTGGMRNQIMTARQIQAAQQRAGWLAAHGYDDAAQSLRGRIDQVRGGLTALKEDERYPFASMLESAEAQKDALQKLLRKAENEGLRVELAGAPLAE